MIFTSCLKWRWKTVLIWGIDKFLMVFCTKKPCWIRNFSNFLNTVSITESDISGGIDVGGMFYTFLQVFKKIQNLEKNTKEITKTDAYQNYTELFRYLIFFLSWVQLIKFRQMATQQWLGTSKLFYKQFLNVSSIIKDNDLECNVSEFDKIRDQVIINI